MREAALAEEMAAEDSEAGSAEALAAREGEEEDVARAAAAKAAMEGAGVGMVAAANRPKTTSS